VASIRLGSISLDCDDPAPLARFWADLLGGEVAFSSEGFVAVRVGATWVTAVHVDGYTAPTWPDGAVAKQIHLDLATDDLEGAAARAEAVGAARADLQPAPDRYLVLLDPAGHPFCVTLGIPD